MLSSERTMAADFGSSATPLTKAAINLDPRHREQRQVAQRGEAGAEIVEGELHALLPQPRQGLGRLFVVEGDVLGDLKLEEFGRQGAVMQDAPPRLRSATGSAIAWETG